MSATTPVTHFTPKTLAALGVAGVLMLALSARTGVAAISPIAGNVALDVPLDGVALGALGMIPPIAYGIAGWLARPLAKRFSLEQLAIVVAVIAAFGHVFRGLAPSYVGLFIVTAILMLAVGVTNVLMPALVKLYAPHRISPVTSSYSLLMAVSTAAPALFGVWLEGAAGWRWSLASWALVSLVAIAPWVILLPSVRRRRAEERLALVDAPPTSGDSPLWSSPTARIMAVMFALSGLVAYSIFAVLPQVLMDQSGFSQEQAGFALFLWATMGVPLSLAIPFFAIRAAWAGGLAIVSALAGATGFIGLVLWPAELTLLWVVLTAVATLNFPLVLTLIPHRTDNHHTAGQLGGMVNTFGYLVGAMGPIAVGVFYALTESWVPSLVLLAIIALANLFAVPVLRRGGSVNEELRQVRGSA